VLESTAGPGVRAEREALAVPFDVGVSGGGGDRRRE